MIVGQNPILLNVTYVKENKELNTSEHFEVIYRSDDGIIHRSEEPPLANIYFTKPEFRNHNYHKPEERIEKLYMRTVPISKIRKTIEQEIGPSGKEFVQQCVQNRDWKALDKLYAWPYSYRADFLEEFYFIDEWMKKYKFPSTIKLTKAFLDIEVAQIDGQADLDNIPNTANFPVNCATVILDETKECFTFVLRPYKPDRLGYNQEEYNERMKYYETQLADHNKLLADMDSFYNDLHESFDDTYGKLRYQVREYESEIELIADIFRLINNRKPNFCLCWNMRFDVQYLVYRIRTLGYNPSEIICHPDFTSKECYFKVDRSTFQLEKQFDYFYCRSYTQYICQMRLYASIRKSQHALKSVALNYIANRELRDRKVEYLNDMNFNEFTHLHWITFIKYNIKDVLLQLGIERKTNDVMTYYLRAMINRTPYHKIFRETHLLRSVREMYFNMNGWVQGNNINLLRLRDMDDKDPFFNTEDIDDEQDNDDEDDGKATFKGAINAEPSMNAHVGMIVLGRPSNAAYQNVIDFDMAAFYPSIKILTNMDPITLRGKVIFKAQDGDMNEEFTSGKMINRSLNQVYEERDKYGFLRKLDHSGEAINTFLTGNILTFGYNWLGLPSARELYDVVKRKSGR